MQNAWLDVRNGGNVGIQGPTNLAIHEQACGNISGCGSCCVWTAEFDRPDPRSINFAITVGACSKAEHPTGCQGTIKVSNPNLLGSQIGTLYVTPQ